MSERDLIVQPTGVTPSGLPYPEDSDPVMQGAQAIKALALALERPWVDMVRWTQGSLGPSVVDGPMTTWDSQQAGGGATLEVNDATGGGFVAPLAGLYEIFANQEFQATWAGGSLMSLGVKTAAVPVRELFIQRAEFGSPGAVRRTLNLSGFLRLAQGEWCRAFHNNGNGTSVTICPGAAPGNRHCARFSARWVAP